MPLTEENPAKLYNKNYESHTINTRKPCQTICLVGFTNVQYLCQKK